MASTIRLQNPRRRIFNTNLENSPKDQVNLMRPQLDGATGKVELVDSNYTTYDTLTIRAMGVSDPLPESILENHAIREAVRRGRLIVVR